MITETIQNILLIAIVIAIILGIAAVPYAAGRKDGYQKGQIDALNGKIYYKLERQENNSFTWVECPAVCEYENREQDGN